jgi:hypothetical protein
MRFDSYLAGITWGGGQHGLALALLEIKIGTTMA